MLTREQMHRFQYHLAFDLDRIAVPRRPCHWIATPDGDSGYEWCPTCGRAKARHLRRHDRRHRSDYILDGGWRTEHDSLPICHGCGAYLDGSLTGYGASYELDHYLENGLSTDPSVDAVYFAEIIGAMLPDHEDAPRAFALAEAVIAAARRPPLSTTGRGEAARNCQGGK